MKAPVSNDQALAMCELVSKCDDRLGRYSDHEGNEDGPAFYFWSLGPERFAEHCDRAIADHREAIAVWERFKLLNDKRLNDKRL